MSNIVNAPPPPRLILLDTDLFDQGALAIPTEIQFRYVPQDFTYDKGVNWGSSTGMNRDNPILQFSSGEQQQFTFGMRLFAQHSGENIDLQYKRLLESSEKDLKLKRPPRWQFIWGTFIDETVVIKSLGGIKFGDIRPDGTLRDVSFSITLLFYRSVDVALVAEDRPADTFFVLTKSGDQWEDLALREYGDPILGEILRRRNPQLPFPGEAPGNIVKLPKIENIRNEAIEPDSIPLRRTTDGLALRLRVYEARSRPRESTILKK